MAEIQRSGGNFCSIPVSTKSISCFDQRWFLEGTHVLLSDMIHDAKKLDNYDEVLKNDRHQIDQISSRMNLSINQIKLFLNPYEREHIELEKKFEEYEEHSIHNHNVEDIKKNYELSNECILLSGKILKKEWDRVSKNIFVKLWRKISEGEI